MKEYDRVTNDYFDFQKFDPDNQQFFTAGELIELLSRVPKDTPVETCRHFGEDAYLQRSVTSARIENIEGGFGKTYVLLRCE